MPSWFGAVVAFRMRSCETECLERSQKSWMWISFLLVPLDYEVRQCHRLTLLCRAIIGTVSDYPSVLCKANISHARKCEVHTYAVEKCGVAH